MVMVKLNIYTINKLLLWIFVKYSQYIIFKYIYIHINESLKLVWRFNVSYFAEN